MDCIVLGCLNLIIGGGGMGMCHSVLVEVKGQFGGGGSLVIPLYGFWGSKAGRQVCVASVFTH